MPIKFWDWGSQNHNICVFRDTYAVWTLRQLRRISADLVSWNLVSRFIYSPKTKILVQRCDCHSPWSSGSLAAVPIESPWIGKDRRLITDVRFGSVKQSSFEVQFWKGEAGLFRSSTNLSKLLVLSECTFDSGISIASHHWPLFEALNHGSRIWIFQCSSGKERTDHLSPTWLWYLSGFFRWLLWQHHCGRKISLVFSSRVLSLALS